ncbi:MAG: hypothetical protein U1C54_07385 [Xanthomonadaceae bacterium]|nr:hypothetical protein [Xanthomonadaceae bacterium]
MDTSWRQYAVAATARLSALGALGCRKFQIRGCPVLFLRCFSWCFVQNRAKTERRSAYRALFDQPTDTDEIETIRLALQRQHALVSAHFRNVIEAQWRKPGQSAMALP